MTKRWTALAAALMLCLALPVFAQSDEPEMDPLLELLVEQGVITAEQATAVQAEYSRREAAKVAEAAPPATPAEAPQVAATEMAPDETASEQVAAAQPAAQPDAAPAKAKWYDKIDFKGDLRFRYEGFWVDGLSDNNHRSRFRLRARAGAYTGVTDWMKVGLQLRSGDPLDPVSDNTSVDTGFSMKQIAMSEAYAAFDATEWLDIRAGKFNPKGLWTVSDLMWDDDVTVEGLLENVKFGAFQANLYQFFLEERKGGEDSNLYGGQVQGSFSLGSKHSLKVGAAYDDWVNPQYVADLTLSGKLHGNRVTNILDDEDQLMSDFQIGSLFAEWKYKLSDRWPIKVTAFGYHNFGANKVDGKKYDDGYFIRFQIGDYKKPGQIALRASRYFSQPDALFYVFTQSDTTMVSDVDGYRFDLRLGFVMKSYFNFTWYHTKPSSDLEDIPTMDRLQVDYIIRF
jgi:Putative porin